MVDLEPVEEEEDLMERLHHHGGDLEHKGRIDILANMSGHDEERLVNMLTNHAKYTGSERARTMLDNWADYRHQIRQGDACRVPSRLARDGTGTHASGGRMRIEAPAQGRRGHLNS